MAKPIPRHLLIHTVTLSVITGTDPYGNVTKTDTPIYRVRLEPIIQTSLTDLGEGKDDKYLLFWDAVNSTPCTFKQLDRVVFQGVQLTVRKVDDLYDEGKLHHKEVYLT